MFDIFNIQKKCIQNKTVGSDCQNNSHYDTNEHVEEQNISTDSNININVTVDLGNWDSGPVRPKVKVCIGVIIYFTRNFIFILICLCLYFGNIHRIIQRQNLACRIGLLMHLITMTTNGWNIVLI